MLTPGTAQLLTSKLRVQARGRWVERGRLHERLERAHDVRLVLVSAPAGFGKTTLLADWLASAQLRSAWLTLDAGDNDIVRFARYVAAAVALLADGAEDGLQFEPGRPFDPELCPDGDPGTDRDCARLQRRVPARPRRLSPDHRARDPPARRHRSSSVFRRMSDSRSPRAPIRRCRWPACAPAARCSSCGPRISGSPLRRRPSSSLDRRRARRCGGRGPDAIEPRAGLPRCGWPRSRCRAGATMPSWCAASGRATVTSSTTSSTRCSPGCRRKRTTSYLRTSILERLCGPLCDAVTGGSDGQARLEELERANLLIVPLDDERRWYRYHALFAEILRSRLSATHHPDEVAELHARASAWHEEQANDDEAIAHALQSGDIERICRVVVFACRARLRAGELSTVRRWLDALPPEVSSPRRGAHRGRSLVSPLRRRNAMASPHWLADAEERARGRSRRRAGDACGDSRGARPRPIVPCFDLRG